jgi:hypothetical protein
MKHLSFRTVLNGSITVSPLAYELRLALSQYFRKNTIAIEGSWSTSLLRLRWMLKEAASGSMDGHKGEPDAAIS